MLHGELPAREGSTDGDSEPAGHEAAREPEREPRPDDDGSVSGRKGKELIINEEGMRALTGGKGTVSPERRKTVHLAMH